MTDLAFRKFCVYSTEYGGIHSQKILGMKIIFVRELGDKKTSQARLFYYFLQAF